MKKGNHLRTMRVALYARVSSEEQKEKQTIDSQVEELRRYAKKTDIEKLIKKLQ